MRTTYDTQADALALDLVATDERWASGDEVHERGNVQLAADGRPLSLEVLYVRDGIDEPLRAAADRYDLDLEALLAAARAALAAPNGPGPRSHPRDVATA